MTTLTTLGGLNMLRSGGVHFDVDVRLVDATLAPLSIGDGSGSTASFQSGPRFEIKIEKALAGGDYALDNVTIRVFVDNERVHEEHHDSGPLARTGTHEWTWNGFTDKQSFSTWDLVDTKIQVMVIARHYPLAQGDYGHIDLRANRPGSRRWLWVRIDKASKEIDVWLRFGLAFMNGGARQFKADLTKLFVDGVEKYWSRSKSDGPHIDGDRYAVKVHAEALSQSDDDTLAFDIYRTNAPKYVRSHNTGVIDGRIYHNAGSHDSVAEADARFEYTSGHEFGHTVLQEAGGTEFSWTHKGTTTLWQSDYEKTPLYPPPPDEIDMMLYYAESPPDDFYARVHATNADVLRLVSLGEVELG
jgi:hypothetical protein